MKKISLSFIVVAFLATSCTTVKAIITDLSEETQLIEVAIDKVTFDSGDREIERITLNITNKSNSTITLISEKCYFQDNKGIHSLKIPPVNIRANNDLIVPIESLDYYQTQSAYGNWGTFSTATESSMGDLNVKYLEINLCYTLNDKEYIGIYRVDVEVVQ
jgi:predicted small secreted protein